MSTSQVDVGTVLSTCNEGNQEASIKNSKPQILKIVDSKQSIVKSGGSSEVRKNVRKPAKRKERIGSSESTSFGLVEQVACYKCKFCLFLSLSQSDVAQHVLEVHENELQTDSASDLQCPGCSDTFTSYESLKVHLTRDHNVAQKELESILSSLGSNDGEATLGEEQQCVVICEVESVEEVDDQSDSAQKHLDSDKVVKENTKTDNLLKKPAERRSRRKQTLLPDETGKIRVRKMSSLEKSLEDDIIEELVEDDSSVLEVNTCQTISTVTTQGISSGPSELHMMENPQEGGQEEHIHMDIQYDIDSMQILNIPLHQQSTEPHVQIIEELGDHNHERNETVQSVVIDSDGSRYCTVSASSACEEIIDEICQEDGLENILYVKSHVCDDRDSPIMVCFAASPETVNLEDDDHFADDNSSVNENMNKDLEMSSTERAILSSCIVDGTNLVGPDGKKLVKRGFVRKAQVRKERVKKPKILKSRMNNSESTSNQQSTSKREASLSGYKCSEFGCPVRLNSLEKMEYHQRCHVPTVVSENTLKVSFSENEPKRGRVLFGKRSFVCPECSSEHHSWKQTKMHLWKCHSIDIEMYTCDQCDYKSPSLNNLKNLHAKIHATEKPYLCDICGKGFKTTKQLRNHKVIHLRKEGSESCDICGRTFHTNRMLRSHIDTVHKKVRPYMCSECGHTAANRSSLKMHLRQHTGDRPYSCDQCEYKTADHNSLRRHKKRHTGDKPYKCPHCPYACIQSSTFKMHLRSKHPDGVGDYMFSCDKCSYHSVSRDMYLAHVAEHDKSDTCEIPFQQASESIQSKRSKRGTKSKASEVDAEVPIYVSIATGDVSETNTAPNFENIVQHVSEAIIPGSNFHVLYNSISVSDPNAKEHLIQIDCAPPQPPFVKEVDDTSAVGELPLEESDLKFQV